MVPQPSAPQGPQGPQGPGPNQRPLHGYSDDHKVELITPEVAAKMLEKNTHNRPLSQAVVDQYVKDMQEGRWLFNKIPILFDWNDVLLDGQHRLWAVVQSGFHMLCVVERNVDPAVFATIDIHHIRPPAQIIGLAGVENSVVIAAIARLVLTYDCGDLSFTESVRPTKTEISGYVIARHQEFEESVRYAYACRELTTPAIAGCCFKIFSRIDHQTATRFFDELTRSGAPATNPTCHLREKLLANKKTQRSKLERRYVLALFFKCWIAYKAGRRMGHLRWAMDSEAFPAL